MDKGNIRFGFGSPPNRGYDNKCASWGAVLRWDGIMDFAVIVYLNARILFILNIV